MSVAIFPLLYSFMPRMGEYKKKNIPFLGFFTKIAKAAITFVMSARLPVCQSVRLSHLPAQNNSAPTGRIFMKFYI
jgi:hypothetical protein